MFRACLSAPARSRAAQRAGASWLARALRARAAAPRAPGADCPARRAAPRSLVWYISPEFDLPLISELVPRLRAAGTALQLLYVHNGHMPDADLQALRCLAGDDAPLLGMAPHVAGFVQRRLDAQPQPGAADRADWVLPTWPYEPQDTQQVRPRARRTAGRANLGRARRLCRLPALPCLPVRRLLTASASPAALTSR